jgi:hypothetical protein
VGIFNWPQTGTANWPLTEAVTHLLRDIAQMLADQANVEVTRVRIGPVDLGSPNESKATA